MAENPVEAIGAPTTDVYTSGTEDANAKVKNWARRADARQVSSAEKAWPTIQQAYSNQEDFAQRVNDYWNIYNCYLDENQSYTGYSQCYVPAVRDCLHSRKKRALQQLFPLNDRHVEAVSEDGNTPYATESLLEHYINNCDLKTKIGAMHIQGDVTGQWNLYVDWYKCTKRVTRLIQAQATLDDEGAAIDPTESFEDIEEAEVTDEHPDVWVVATTDIAVIPPTVDDLNEADIVSICHRMSKARVQHMIDRGIFVGAKASELVVKMDVKPKDQSKKRLEDIGIKTEGTDKHAVVFEAHMCMKLDHDDKEDAVVWYRGDGKVLGVIRNPLWSKKRPLISAPVEKIAGQFFGKSAIEPVRFLQWQANDMMNIGQDAVMYCTLPVIMTDPEKNPQYQSMVLTMAAVWPVDPNSTKTLTFPDIWQHAFSIVGGLEKRIQQSLDVNDYQLGQMPSGRKNNAQVGAVNQEGQVGVSDRAKDIENRILNPMLEMMFELDTQYRTEETTILTMGEVGVRAHMERVRPHQFSAKYFFRWLGTDFMISMQRIQQQIAAMNVIRGIPPQALSGKRIDITPILVSIVETVFGSRLAPKIIIDERDQLALDPSIENEMLWNGLDAPVHQLDNDPLHLQSHAEAARATMDPSGMFRKHMMLHMKQMQMKAMASNPIQPPGQQGVPGGAGPGGNAPAPGVPGSPRMGALPGNVRPLQAPPGSVHQDQMISPEAVSRG